jgi:RNA recognition motif-containing protein
LPILNHICTDDAASTKSAGSFKTAPASPPRLRRVKSSEDLRADSAASASHQVAKNNDEVKPRADRGRKITPANAQGLCPPDACLFAANLEDNKSVEDHERDLLSKFGCFGECYPQIKTDRKGHEFAILQFETVEQANNALRHGQGMLINGRPLRLEKAKVERALLITDMEGKRVITEHEARSLLTHFGQIEFICTTDLIPGRPSGLPRGQYVRFMYWLDCRDAMYHFHEKYDDSYRLQLANGLEPRLVEYDQLGATIVRGLDHGASSVDRRSVFIGNLPEDASKPEVEAIFSNFGTVVMANVVKKAYPNVNNYFAFVEFSSVEEVEAACNADVTLRERKLRIEPKEYTARRKSRLTWSAAQEVQQPRVVCPERPEPSRPRWRLDPAAQAALAARLAGNQTTNAIISDQVANVWKDEFPTPKGDRSDKYTPPHRRVGGGYNRN